jgi:acyl-CoA reductase-like NAD-dependent aldehyde dehydrogenase
MDLGLRFTPKGDYVAGSFLSTSGYDGVIERHDPCDPERLLGSYRYSRSSGNRALGAARAAATPWAQTSIDGRVRLLLNYRRALEGSLERLWETCATETGRPLWEVRAEAMATLHSADLLIDRGPELLADREAPEVGGTALRKPLGVTLLITPLTLPLAIPVTAFLTSLLAGNSVIWKPSSRAPACAQILAELWDGIKAPRGIFNLVHGPGAEIARPMAADRRVDLVLFAGSCDTAGNLREQVVRPGLRWGMHCGGRGQAIVLEDADLDAAAYEIVAGAMLSAGQRRNATARALISAPVFEDLARRIEALMTQVRIGSIGDPEVFMGPLPDRLSAERFQALCDRTAARCAVRLPGGRDPELGPGFHVRPMLFDLPETQPLPDALDGTVGPALALTPVEDLDTAIATANRTNFGLACSVFTHDQGRFEQARDGLRANFINWNRGTAAFSFLLPSGGSGSTSDGLEGNLEMLRFVTQPCAVLGRPARFDNDRRLPGFPPAGARPGSDGPQSS